MLLVTSRLGAALNDFAVDGALETILVQYEPNRMLTLVHGDMNMGKAHYTIINKPSFLHILEEQSNYLFQYRHLNFKHGSSSLHIDLRFLSFWCLNSSVMSIAVSFSSMRESILLRWYGCLLVYQSQTVQRGIIYVVRRLFVVSYRRV